MNTQALKEKAGILSVGLIANALMVYGFDYVLYPFVMWKLGLIWGWVAMTVTSFLVCWATLVFYDWSKKDWIGIEMLKGLREKELQSRFGKILNWIFRKGDFAMMIFLSIKFDPFITTAYMRHGQNKFNGFSKRDWINFIGSVVVANVYWAPAMFLGVSAIEWLWLKTK